MKILPIVVIKLLENIYLDFIYQDNFFYTFPFESNDDV